jgi:folate-binding protein YgfZ
MHPFFYHASRSAQPSPTSPTSAITVHYLDDGLCVLAAQGEDALSFLQGQITNDLAAAGLDSACLAGYCTAQGRLLATGVFSQGPVDSVNAAAHNISIVLRKDIAAAVTKRLSMFVLRSKVKIAPTALNVAGVFAPSHALDSLQSVLAHDLPLTPWQARHTASGTWIAAPASLGTHRWWWLASEQAAEELGLNWTALTQTLQAGETSSWFATDIQQGLPWIEAKTQDLFIPQTLNLDLIQGVSFTKGCYPGQEIVARSHYRGTLKRRMTLARLDVPLDATIVPGVDVYEGDEPCGRIINISNEGQTSWLLIEAPFDAMDRNALCVGAADGPHVALQALPYAIRAA